MCYEFDFYYIACRVLARRARKQHRCDECSGTIAAGERYLCTDALAEDGPITHRQCRRCVFDRMRIRQAELAAGCFHGEAEPGDGDLFEALYDRDWQPTPCDQVPAEFDVAEYLGRGQQHAAR